MRARPAADRARGGRPLRPLLPAPRPVEETIELVGLGEKRDARVGTLSGGQKRRADVAIGIIGDPDLIFLDEPTTGFDPTARRDAWNMIEGLKALGKTVFLTTHYMDEAQHLADRVAILRDGRIVAQGRTEELGASLGRRTVIGFTLNGGLGVEDVRSARLRPGPGRRQRGRDRDRAARRPTSTACSRLAEERGAELEELEVRRPSLEDIFLELTREEERVSDRGIVLAQARMAILVALRTPRAIDLHRRLPADPARPLQLDLHQRRRRQRRPCPTTLKLSAQAYFTAGIIAYAVALSTFTTLAVSLTTQRENGQLKRYRGTPMPPWTFIAAQIVRATAQALVMTALLLAVGALAYGVPIPGSTFPAFVLYVVLGTATCCSLGIALTAFTPTPDCRLDDRPLHASSSSPSSPASGSRSTSCPSWLETVGKVFPLYHLALGLQTTLAPGASGSGLDAGNVLVLAIWALAGARIASTRFRWEPQAARARVQEVRRPPHMRPSERSSWAICRTVEQSVGRLRGGSPRTRLDPLRRVLSFRAGLGGLDLAVLRRRRGDQTVEQLRRHLGDFLDRVLERLWLACEGLVEPLILRTYCRPRRGLLLGRGWLEIVEGLMFLHMPRS